MDRLLCALKGEAKKSVESIEKSGIFHVIALKTLKRNMKLTPIRSEISRIFGNSSL